MTDRKKRKLIALALGMLLGAGVCPSSHAQVPDNWDVDGEHGIINVHGSLAEAACVLDLGSIYQEVNLGVTSTASLMRAGDRGEAIPFVLTLRECVHMRGSVHDLEADNYTDSPVQPVVAISFLSVSDADNPELVKVKGIGGMGIRLMDSSQQNIHLKRLEAPQFVTPGDNQLIFYAAPERTKAPLTAGKYRAVVNFSLIYD